MEGLGIELLKILLLLFAAVGLTFHLLVLKSPETGKKIEEKLGKEYGIKKRFVSWLEEPKMGLQERLIRSKAYNIFAVIFLIILLVLLVQI